MTLQIQSFFDPQTCTFSHLVHAGPGTACAVVDPVLGYDPDTGVIDTVRVDEVIAAITHQQLKVEWILETHIHADHLSAAAFLRGQTGGVVATNKAVLAVQQAIRHGYGLPDDYCAAEAQFDYLFEADEHFTIGALRAQAWHAPGHTPSDTAYVVEGRAVFVGDTLFLPDVGTARCDFTGGSALQLYRSIQRLLALPGETQLFMCHDYPPDGRQPCSSCTVAQQLSHNEQVRLAAGEEAFVLWRNQRDAALAAPRLLKPSLLVNLRAGVLPTDSYGVHFLPPKRSG